LPGGSHPFEPKSLGFAGGQYYLQCVTMRSDRTFTSHIGTGCPRAKLSLLQLRTSDENSPPAGRSGNRVAIA
jgi:hypothetical protein